jgi:tetratricopeptide (TPR) repeat protein
VTLQSDLTALESSGLIRLAQVQPDLEYLFKHALIQDAAYESILKVDRKKLHQLIGEALERLYADRLAEVAPLLADHFDKSDDHARALKYFFLAGDAASAVYANAEAAQHYARALALAKQQTLLSVSLSDLYARYGRVLEFLYQYPRALQLYEEMQHAGQERGDKLLELTSLTTRITLFSTPTPLFDTARGRELFEPALALARELSDRRVEAKILWTRMLNNYFSGDFKGGIVYGEQALSIAREINDREQIAFALNDLSRAYLSTGAMTRANEVLIEAQALWRELNNRHMLTDSLVSMAEGHLLAGEYETTLRFAQEGIDVARAAQNTWGENFGLSIIAYAHAELGDFDRALDCFEKSVRAGLDLNIQFLWGVVADLALLYSELGVPQRGIALLNEVEDKAQSSPAYLYAWTLGGFVLLYIQQGDFARAEQAWQKAQTVYDPEYFFGFAPFLMGLADCYLSLAQHKDHEAILASEKMIVLMERFNASGYIVEALSVKARALAHQGRLLEAVDVFSEARERADKLTARRILWKVLLWWSQVEGQRGDAAEAQKLLAESRNVLNYVLDHLTIPDLRAPFLNTPEVKAVLANP